MVTVDVCFSSVKPEGYFWEIVGTCPKTNRSKMGDWYFMGYARRTGLNGGIRGFKDQKRAKIALGGCHL